MNTRLYKNWWFLFIKGFLTTVLGILILLKPEVFLTSGLLVLGIILGLAGISITIGAISHIRTNYGWTWWLVEGLMDILIALVLILQPMESAGFLGIILGLWIFLMGIVHLATAINIQYYIPGNLVYVILAALLLTSGLFFIINPVSGLKVLMVLIGSVIAVFGLLQLLTSLVLKNIAVDEIEDPLDL